MATITTRMRLIMFPPFLDVDYFRSKKRAKGMPAGGVLVSMWIDKGFCEWACLGRGEREAKLSALPLWFFQRERNFREIDRLFQLTEATKLSKSGIQLGGDLPLAGRRTL
jgi:hypothetical protein